MKPSSADLYDALYLIGNEAGTSVDIRKNVLDYLVTLEIAEIGADGKPHLTLYGDKCYFIMESGYGRVAEFE